MAKGYWDIVDNDMYNRILCGTNNNLFFFSFGHALHIKTFRLWSPVRFIYG